jgi:YbgC/YbaW family acyl-CoA thioester hydrolase
MVQFGDTDMAGIAHFTNYMRYMEEAEHEFMRSRGFSVIMHDNKGAFGFPKMSAKCDFSRPARQEQTLDIEMTVSSSDGKTITFDCQFACEGEPVAKGQLKVACCRFPGDGRPYPIPIPEVVLSALETESAA